MTAEINSPKSALGRITASLRPEHWLSSMLLALHGALLLELADPLAKALLVSHIGLFLLWQPIWRGEQKLLPGQVALILLGGALLVVAHSWWLIALWISVLLALIGGNVPGIKNFAQRMVSLLAAVYLLAILLMWVVPHLFAETVFPSAVQALVRYGLLLPPLAIFFIRSPRPQTQSGYSLDLFYSVLLFLLVVVLVLGAFTIKQVSQGNYVLALAQALIVIAVLLVALSWLWDPRGGFAGIGQLLSRYFLSVGVPFERWMHNIAGIAGRERDPDKFVILAAHEMSQLPWLAAVRWRAAGTSGQVGESSKHVTELTSGGLTLVLYTRFSPSPALLLHIRLLARLLGDYYDAKVREQEQRRMAYMQAIYETGSRLTHDVKNLLQTLRSLCAAAENSGEDDADAVRMLMQRQLPQITQRLQITLDKLSSKPSADPELVDAGSWWTSIRERFLHEKILFSEENMPAAGKLPRELFETAAENFLQNAIEKRKREPEIALTAILSGAGGRYSLRVCDGGKPVPDGTAQHLLSAPVSSHSGLGVGLYQLARFARDQGYRIALASNEPGKVCFELAPETAGR
jgi:signal transduction histidine kinase